MPDPQRAALLRALAVWVMRGGDAEVARSEFAARYPGAEVEPATLTELREHRGLSQADLAAAVRVTEARISAIEGGRGRVSLDLAERIAEALEVEVDDLAGAPVAR
jgi:DNA-binding XRE family transcriptional regulator